jgi:hypothetical protein
MLDNASKELEDTIANAADSDNKYVLMVRNGYRENDPSITYDTAFSSFFGTPRWNYFKGENGEDVVEFTGDCIYQDVSVKARIQFVVDEENGTFDATYLAVNEVPQNMFLLVNLIDQAFDLELDDESSDYYEDDTYYEDDVSYEDTAPINMDPNLIGGRWVSANGDRLEFFADGNVTTSLDLWSFEYGVLFMGNDDRILSWEASNGELILWAYTTSQFEYTMTDDGFMEVDFGNYSVTYRNQNRIGSNELYGEWMPWDGSGGNGFALYEDGTAIRPFRDGICTWSNETEGIIDFFYKDGRSFDYLLQGDQLILYGQSSSTIYTRIGQ